MSLDTYNARQLIADGDIDRFESMVGKCQVELDDGVVTIGYFTLWVNLHYWGYIKYLPFLPLSKAWVMKGIFKPDTPYAKLITPLARWLTLNGYSNREVSMLQQFALETDALLVHKTSGIKYATTLDNADVLELRDEVTMELLKNRTRENIEAIFAHWEKTYPTNALVVLLKCGLVRKLGVELTFLSVGPMTNGRIPYRRPIEQSFWEGIFSNISGDSEKERLLKAAQNIMMGTSWPMAAWGAKSILQACEAMRRSLIVVMDGPEMVRGDDCGVTWGFPHTVRSLPSVIGLHYKLDNQEPVWRVFVDGDDEMVGRTVMLRTAMTCQTDLHLTHHPGKWGVCKACLGPIHTQYATHVSPMFVAISAHTAKHSQGALSKKHQHQDKHDAGDNTLDPVGEAFFVSRDDAIYRTGLASGVLLSTESSLKTMHYLQYLKQDDGSMPPNSCGNASELNVLIDKEVVVLPLNNRVLIHEDFMGWLGKHVHPEQVLININGVWGIDLNRVPVTVPMFKVVRSIVKTMDILECIHAMYNGSEDEPAERWKPYEVFQRFIDSTYEQGHHVGSTATMMPGLMIANGDFSRPGNGHYDAITTKLTVLKAKGGLRATALLTGYANSLATPGVFTYSRPHWYDELLASHVLPDVKHRS